MHRLGFGEILAVAVLLVVGPLVLLAALIRLLRRLLDRGGR